MEHSDEETRSNEEPVETRKLNRRSSILKPPKVQNENQISRTSRRVSFSSNFIKAFTTDDDKNTIWDTTVEETLSATESSHSQNFKDSQSRYLDSTMINDNLFPAVKNYENRHQTTVKDKVVSPQDGKENLKHTEKSVLDTSNMELTCKNLPFIPNTEKSVLDTSNMELTCKNLPIIPNTEKSVLDTSNMELTCKNLPIIPNTFEPNHIESFAPMEFTCRNISFNPNIIHNQTSKIPSLDQDHKKENNIGTKLYEIPLQQGSFYLANESNTAEFPIRNYLDKTNVSNISALDTSKGISLIQGSTQRPYDMSIAGVKGPMVDLPSFNFTIPEVIVTPFSSKPKGTSSDVGSSTAVDLPSFNLTDGNPKLGVSLPEAEITEKVSDSLNLINEEDTGICQSNLSQIVTSQCLSKSNINLSISSLCNVDDTQQLLIDASKLSRTKPITSIDNSVENTSGTQMNKTYLVEDHKIKSIPKEVEEEVNEKQLPLKEDIQQLDQLSKCVAEFSKDNFIIDSTIDLISDETLELASNDMEVPPSNNFDIEENIMINQRKSGVCSENVEKNSTKSQDIQENVSNKRFTAAELMALRRKDIMELEKKLEALTFVPEKKEEFEFIKQNARMKELVKQSEELDKVISSRYAIFKKQLKDVIELRQNKLLTPEELSGEEEPVENDDFESGILTTIKGMVQKIEEKSKMCDHSWKIIKLEDGIAVFTTYFEKLEVTVDYSPHDYIVRQIQTKSLLTDKAKPIGFLMQKEFLRLLSPSHISKSIGHHYNVLSLLDYIQMLMDKIRKHWVDLKELQKKYDLELTNEFEARFYVLSEYLAIKWDFTIQLSDLENITKDSITVRKDIGDVDPKPTLDLISECPKGLEFLKSFVVQVELYLESLIKRDIQFKSRKC